MDNSEWIYARAFDIADTRQMKSSKNASPQPTSNTWTGFSPITKPIAGPIWPGDQTDPPDPCQYSEFRVLRRPGAPPKARGYTFISLAEALEDKAYVSEDTLHRARRDHLAAQVGADPEQEG